MKRKVKEGIVWLEFEVFQPFPEIQHAIILRHGGVSQGSFSSLNLSRSGGDQLEPVLTNFAKVKTILTLPETLSAYQVHGNVVHTVSQAGGDLTGDGLITVRPELALMVTHADCQGTLFYDPRQRAIAAVHCGWRGSTLNIYAETVQRMVKEFGTNPSDLRVGISPSLGPFHAEFIHYRTELPESFWPFESRPNHFDFWKISEKQLTDLGIPLPQIETARLCTYANPEDYYSYRRCKERGGHISLIAMRDR